MNQNNPKIFQLNLSGISFWLILLSLSLLLGSVGLGWLVNSFLIIIGLAIIAPVIAFLGFRWWLNRNMIEDECPVCGYEFTGFNQSEFRCPNCQEPLKVENKQFQRLAPPGTIDVKAVEVSTRAIED